MNNKEKINEYFLNIKTESVISALRSQKYSGINRNQIYSLLKKYTLESVFLYLKNKYRKINYLLIYTACAFFMIFISTLTIGILHFFFKFDFIQYYLKIKNLLNLEMIDYLVFIFLGIFLIIIFMMILELILKFKKPTKL